MMNWSGIAELTYGAYRDSMESQGIRIDDSWDELPMEERLAWESAAQKCAEVSLVAAGA